MKRFNVNILIIRKNFNKTKSAKFKGKISIVCNEYGIIYDWKVKFLEVYLDLYTTKSWFEGKNGKTTFHHRQSLFKKLNLIQEIRPQKGIKNKILKLNNQQIELLNNYFNDRELYDSTIKNIVGVLKGNNPGGEAAKPSSAEMIMDNNKNNISNFVILLDDLIVKQKVNYEAVYLSSQQISSEDFMKLNFHLEQAFQFMQKEKNDRSWQFYLDGIKKYYQKYNKDVLFVQKLLISSRSKYTLKIEKQIKKYPFNFESSKQFQKCHIYEIHIIRDKVIEAIRNKQSYKKYLKMAEDINNFIPLPEEIHRQFDRHIFTYQKNGKILSLNQEGKNYIDLLLKDHFKNKFKKIPIFFLNEDRIKYLEMRNEELDI